LRASHLTTADLAQHRQLTSTTTTSTTTTKPPTPTQRVLKKVMKLLSKAWKGWDSTELAMDSTFLLRLAQTRTNLLPVDQAPFTVPSLAKASLRPENAFSEMESERRVHCLIGEAIFLGLQPAMAEMRRLMDEARA
jgi:hypothetical protein